MSDTKQSQSKKELEEKMFSIAPEPFEAQIPKYESFPDITPDIVLRARKGALGYRGKWVILEHVKGSVSYLFSNGTSIGHATMREWIFDPSQEGPAYEPVHKAGFTRSINSLFKAVQSLYPDMAQMRIHVVSYDKTSDVESNYKNEILHHVVTDIFVGELSNKDSNVVLFTPVPFDRLISFLTNPLQDVYGSNKPVRLSLIPPPVIKQCESLDECLDFKVTDDLVSLLPYVGSNVPVQSVLIRPETANLKLGPETKKKKKTSSALTRIKARTPEKTAPVVSADRLILKRKAAQASVNELFTAHKLLKLMKQDDEQE